MIKFLYALFGSLHNTCSALIPFSSVGNPNHILRGIHDMKLIIILLSPFSILLSLPRFYSKYHPQQSVFNRLKSVLPAGRKTLAWRNDHKIFFVYFNHCVISCSKFGNHKILNDNKCAWNKFLIYLWIWIVFPGYFQMRMFWFYDSSLHSSIEAVIASFWLLSLVFSLVSNGAYTFVFMVWVSFVTVFICGVFIYMLYFYSWCHILTGHVTNGMEKNGYVK